VKSTEYFDTSVMARRPYLKVAWIEFVLTHPFCKEIQENGRIRYWAFIDELGKYLRVVTESDGETVHNAFPDRGFKP
jgi:hypothetical protein